jgi:hypothetical protein
MIMMPLTFFGAHAVTEVAASCSKLFGDQKPLLVGKKSHEFAIE